jgi:phosphoenolpyruvate-protein phosphotransferase (PTS system enzyme I)
MGGRPLVIRTLDLGADKFPPELGGLEEKNPFLGSRSLRYCFQHPELLKAQLRAILRASAFGEVSILLPMVSTLDDLRRAQGYIEECKGELKGDGIPHKEEIKVGTMIEVPSAALIAERLAEECDFFSIGTNDLIQYTLAVDRGNQRVADRYNPADPAILRLIRFIIEAGKKKRIPVAMCGEMSGDIDYSILLLGMGLRIFSLSPLLVPEIKQVIRSVKVAQAEEVAAKAMMFSDPKDTLEFLRKTTRELVPDLYLDTELA